MGTICFVPAHHTSVKHKRVSSGLLLHPYPVLAYSGTYIYFLPCLQIRRASLSKKYAYQSKALDICCFPHISSSSLLVRFIPVKSFANSPAEIFAKNGIFRKNNWEQETHTKKKLKNKKGPPHFCFVRSEWHTHKSATASKPGHPHEDIRAAHQETRL